MHRWQAGRGDGGDRGPRRCSPKGRRNGGSRVGAAAGTASGWRRGPRIAALPLEGATQRQRKSRCSRKENHGAAARRPDGAMWRQPDARSVERRAELGDDLHGTCGGERNRRPGRSRGVDEADRGGERVIKQIVREVGDAARWRRGGGGVRDEPGDDGRRGTSCGRACQHRHPGCQSNAGARAARPERPTEQRRTSSRQPTGLTQPARCS